MRKQKSRASGAAYDRAWTAVIALASTKRSIGVGKQSID
jgi:hypothetical protein